MIKIDQNLIADLASQAANLKRKRINFNFHKEAADPLQRLLNVMQPETYLQPHKHENPDKREVFIALSGKFLALEFDETGNIADWMILDPDKGNYAAEVPARTYHSIICLECDSAIYELKDGPYNPDDDKHFASWAPKEGSEECKQFINRILLDLGLKYPEH
jgi:cupin fold WbuC family metalloprotein